jgi:hypothetical protein
MDKHNSAAPKPQHLEVIKLESVSYLVSIPCTISIVWVKKKIWALESGNNAVNSESQ